MVSLRSLDDQVRAELTGKRIGSADPGIQTSAKDLLKSARTNFNRREYISGVSDLGMFHKKMQDITNLIKKFFVDVNKIHHKFLFEGVEDEKVKKLREHMEKKLAQELRMELIKEAGIMDFFYNIGTKRGRGLAAWEKKYPKETKNLREGGAKLLDSADALLANTISFLKEMATARAIRRPDDYMDSANKIKAEFEKFDGGDKGFRAYYNTAIMPFMQIKDDIDSGKYKPEVPPGTPTPVELGEQPPPAPGQAPAPTPAAQPLPPVPDLNVPQGAKPAPAGPEETHPTDKNPSPNRKLNHERFYESLESMSKEDPRILAGYITKYAKSIQESDLETAIKLFAVVKRLKG
jgi:hypothetical protein